MKADQKRRTLVAAACAGVALAFGSVCAVAADFPDRPARLIVPFPPGGATDILGRLLAESMSRTLKQQVIVENRPGANTIIGASEAARSKPDGYTMFLAAGSTLVLNPLLYKTLAYDPARDFRILDVVGEVPLIVVVPNSSPSKNLAEFVQQARKEDGRVNYGSVGTGSTLHLAAELFGSAAKVKMTHVPYKGSAAAMTDLIGGQIDAIFDAYSTAFPQVQGGKIRALAVTSDKRLDTLPDVPTVSESVPDYRAIVWYAVVVPQGVPDAIAQTLKGALGTAFKDAGFRQAAEKAGFIVGQTRSDAEIKRYVDDENRRWSALIKAQNIQLENN